MLEVLNKQVLYLKPYPFSFLFLMPSNHDSFLSDCNPYELLLPDFSYTYSHYHKASTTFLFKLSLKIGYKYLGSSDHPFTSLLFPIESIKILGA